jgi:hypothetical protein
MLQNGLDVAVQRFGSRDGYLLDEKFHTGGCKGTLLQIYYQAVLLKALKKKSQVKDMLLV